MFIQYARATLQDLPAVVDLCMAVEAQHEAYWPLRWQRRPGLHEGYLNWLSRRLDEPRLLVQVARDPAAQSPDGFPLVVGTILANIEKEIPIYVHTEFAFIQDMAVNPAYRRQGIAQNLLAHAAHWARSHGLNQLRLMAAQQNPTAIAAFAKAGFRTTYHEMVLPL